MVRGVDSIFERGRDGHVSRPQTERNKGIIYTQIKLPNYNGDVTVVNLPTFFSTAFPVSVFIPSINKINK